MTRQDSNLQSPAPWADALSIGPRGHMLVLDLATHYDLTHGEVLEEEPLVITLSVSEDGFPDL